MTAKKHHWIVYPPSCPTGTIIYEKVDYVPIPTSSLIAADEIDGLDRTQALRVLRSMYPEVKEVERSNRIFCKK